MSVAAAPVKLLALPIPPEDLARADMYALISRLFYAPDAQLLKTIASADAVVADSDPAPLAQAWRALVAAAAVSDAETVREEYEGIFIGLGKPEVMLYGSYYLAGFMMEKPLAQLRDDLARLGLARTDSIRETEDHISALSDVMRILIAGDGDRAGSDINQQKQFFSRHLQTWQERFCAAVQNAESANFYKHVARFVRVFFAIEIESFDMVY